VGDLDRKPGPSPASSAAEPRARTPTGVDREIHALLVTYQILHTAMTDATNSDKGVDP
jgi:hypothetical protein